MRKPARLVPVKVKAGRVVNMPQLRRRVVPVRISRPGAGKVFEPDKNTQKKPESVTNGEVSKIGNVPAQAEANGRNKVVTPLKTTFLGTSKVNLLEKLWARAKPQPREDELITSIIRLTHSVVGSSASSLLLLDDNSQELYFKFADGPVSKQLKRLHISRQSGIAGWIVRNAKPLVVNDPGKNANFYRMIDEATGFKTRSIIGVPIIIGDRVDGVIEVLNKADGTNFTKQDLRIMLEVAETAAKTIETTRMNTNLLNSYKGTVDALVYLADTKESSGGGHSRRVTDYALIGARALSLSKEEKQDIEYAAILHDIGKLSIPDSVLNKTGKLTDEEWELIKKHPAVGYNLLKDIPFLKEASKLILYHHERYDGKGYPQGIRSDSLPIGARLIAVADAFDYMTTDHVHQKALSLQKAFAELHKHAGTQFCPAAVKAFNSGYVRSRLSKK